MIIEMPPAYSRDVMRVSVTPLPYVDDAVVCTERGKESPIKCVAVPKSSARTVEKTTSSSFSFEEGRICWRASPP
jgi:hypothetical protein